jgi:recombination protein RecT
MTNTQQEQQQPKTNGDRTEKYIGEFTKREVVTLRADNPQLNDHEFEKFLHICVNNGLNPFKNHVVCNVFNGKNGRNMSVTITAEGVLHLARKNKNFKGIDTQLVHENDEFQIDVTENKIQHKIGFPRGRVLGGYCIAKHAELGEKVFLMDVEEVEHMKKGRNASMWTTWFNDMFRKHMVIRTAKEQFGVDVSDDVIVQSSATEGAIQMQQQPAAPGRVEVGEDQFVDENAEIRKLWANIKADADAATIKKVMQKTFAGRSEQSLNLAEVVALQKMVGYEVNKKQNQPEPEPQQPQDEFDEFDSYFD